VIHASTSLATSTAMVTAKQTKFGLITVYLGAGLTAQETILKPAQIYQYKINTKI